MAAEALTSPGMGKKTQNTQLGPRGGTPTREGAMTGQTVGCKPKKKSGNYSTVMIISCQILSL